ncbi:MAG: glycosyl hydrolase [Clostridiaceae bacterium]
MLKDILADIQKPDTKYRGIPFWSWNDELDPEELRWQIKQMKEAGLGGYFMHARAGLRTPYLDEEWMNCVAACIDEGDLQGLQSWIYDENGYPSGFAAGKLPAMGVEYQQKFLKFEIIRGEEAAAGPTTLGFYRTDGDYGRVNPDNVRSGESVLHVYYEMNPFYADLLDEDVVKKFIEMTHDVYYRKFKEHFGNNIPGIFTDEPQYGRTAMPWSFILPKKFNEKNGYEIIDYLSALYFKIPGFRKIRYDFWNLVTELFTGAVSRQMGEWCEKYGCKLTGHVLLEEDIRFQTMCSGSAMAFYRYMQMPGIDWLGRDIGNPVIIKQVASVGEQLGKEQILSEMFAAAGWGASPEELKRIAEWQYSLGVNVICAHLEGYSLRGLRKRDHPPGLFYQTNWWRDYRKFNDYFARLGMLLSEGGKGAGILVIHPLRSGWVAFDESCYKKGANTELEYIDDSFAKLSTILTGLHLGYHYGDEGIIAEFGNERNGMFVIGDCSYRVVLIPPATTLEPDTARLLGVFIKNGGKVFAFEDFPYMIKGVETEDLRILKKSCTTMKLEPQDIKEKLEKAGCREISVQDENNLEISAILHKICYYQDGSIIFLANTDKKQVFNAEISVNRTGACYVIDLEECGISKLPAVAAQNSSKFNLSFAPCQSYVIAITDEPLSNIDEAGEAPESRSALPLESVSETQPESTMLTPLKGRPAQPSDNEFILKLRDAWKVKTCGLNAMTLDYCQVSIDNGGWSECKPVIAVQRELLRLERSADIALKYVFNSKCSFDKGREMYLVVEEADKYILEVNGKPVYAKAEGWWKDKSFHKINVCGLLGKGLNTILLRTRFYNSPEAIKKIERAKVFEAEMNMLSFDSEIESIYLLGEFIVTGGWEYIQSGRNALIQQGGFQLDEPGELRCSGELTVCGYPFFSGNALFEQEIELEAVESIRSMIFKMERPNSALSRLYVNGHEVKTFLWAPYEAEIRPYVRDGVNTITLELVSTDRNLFGPHHHPKGELYNLGPLQFTDIEGWKDSYCFVRFGLEGKPYIYCYGR